MRITLKQLEYFVTTAEAGSIKLASDRLSISAPSISTAISQLEEQLQLQLFVRKHAQGLSLTVAGKRLSQEAKSMLRQADNLYSIAGELRNEITGKLTIGCMVTLAPMILPELLHRFSKQNANVSLGILEGSHEQLLSGLHSMEIDAAISYDLQFPEDIEFYPLASLPPYVVLSREHKFARNESLTLKQLADEPQVLLDLPYSRDYFSSLFQSEKLRSNVATRSGSIEVVRSLVANGFGYSIANARPKNRSTQDGKRLVHIPLEGEHQPMILGLATRADEIKTRLLCVFEEHCFSMISNDKIPGMKIGKL